MAEDKTKVGRPKKEEKEPLVDEKAEVLMMTDNSDQSQSSSDQETKRIVIADLTAKYKQIFSKYTNAVNQTGYHVNTINNLVSDLQNPFIQNTRLKRLVTLPAEFEKESLIDAIKDPGNHEMMLRSAVGSLSASNYLFYKMLREATDVPSFKHYIVPPLLEKAEDYKKDDFKHERKIVYDWVREFDVVNTFKRIALETKKEGKSVYMLRNSFSYDKKGIDGVNYAYLQKMPADYVKLTYMGKLGYGASFNMMWFFTPGTNPKQFDPYIQQIWEDMNRTGIIIETKKKMKQLNPFKASTYQPLYKGKKMGALLEKTGDTYYYWVTLPQDLCYVFASDMSNAFQAPDTAGLLLDLQNLASFTDASALLTVQRLCQFLTAEVEVVPSANAGRDSTYISPNTLDALNAEFDNKVSENVTSFFAPLKNFKLHSLDTSSVNSSEILTAATTNFISRADEAGLIISNDKPSVFAIKVATKKIASQYDAVTRQFERVVNFILQKMLGFQHEWRIKIFGDIFSLEEEKSFLKECVAGGSTFFLPKLLACEDIDTMEAEAIVNYLDSIGIYDKLVTPTMLMSNKLAKQNMKNNSSDKDDEMANGVKKVGRPAKKDPDSDSTEESKDRGDDISEIKNEYFSAEDVMKDIEEHRCIICHKKLDFDLEQEQKICEECKETFDLHSSDEE